MRSTRFLTQLLVCFIVAPSLGPASAQGVPMDSKSVLDFATKHNAKILDLRFIDVPGIWQHVSFPIHNSRKVFRDGFGMDASSIRGWASIHESDMLLMPDPTHALHGPVPRHAHSGDDRRRRRSAHAQALPRDTRSCARNAEAYLAQIRHRRPGLLRRRSGIFHFR